MQLHFGRQAEPRCQCARPVATARSKGAVRCGAMRGQHRIEPCVMEGAETAEGREEGKARANRVSQPRPHRGSAGSLVAVPCDGPRSSIARTVPCPRTPMVLGAACTGEGNY